MGQAREERDLGAAQESSGRGLSEISRRVIEIFRGTTGCGPAQATTAVHDDVVTIVLRDTLTESERRLVDGGSADQVLETRRLYQGLMRDELVALVQEVLGRRVLAFMSDNHVNPDLAVETFVLAPLD
jgi:uncharacterized protein YbcI